jgi:hypothetical protein
MTLLDYREDIYHAQPLVTVSLNIIVHYSHPFRHSDDDTRMKRLLEFISRCA